MAPVLKTGRAQALVGSNPTPSATRSCSPGPTAPTAGGRRRSRFARHARLIAPGVVQRYVFGGATAQERPDCQQRNNHDEALQRCQCCLTFNRMESGVAPGPRPTMVRSGPELPYETMLNRLLKFCALGAFVAAFSGCGTVTDMVTSHVPERHSGRASIVVDLGEQEAYLYRGKHRTASSRISSGREGHRTPVGRFAVIRKDIDHRSSLYGSYVDYSGRIVKGNVDTRKDSKPPHSHFEGAPMPFFLEFSPGVRIAPGLSARRAGFTRLYSHALLESSPVL